MEIITKRDNLVESAFTYTVYKVYDTVHWLKFKRKQCIGDRRHNLCLNRVRSEETILNANFLLNFDYFGCEIVMLTTFDTQFWDSVGHWAQFHDKIKLIVNGYVLTCWRADGTGLEDSHWRQNIRFGCRITIICGRSTMGYF